MAAKHECEKWMDVAKKDKTRCGEISAECDEENGHGRKMGAEDCTTYGGETKEVSRL